MRRSATPAWTRTRGGPSPAISYARPLALRPVVRRFGIREVCTACPESPILRERPVRNGGRGPPRALARPPARRYDARQWSPRGANVLRDRVRTSRAEAPADATGFSMLEEVTCATVPLA